MLKLYDTYTKEKREFKPIVEGLVKYYSCGPTVYFSSHIGHVTVYAKTDMLKQYLKHWKGYNVLHAQNITDFGHMVGDEDGELDKMKKGMESENKSAAELAKHYTDEFHESMEKLKVESPDFEPRASENVPEMIEFIQRIIDNGYAYEKNGNVYFDTQKLKEYGKLSNKKIDEQEVKERLDSDPNKKHPFDFILWTKHRDSHSHVWDSPWGKGMPGWHIECSVMSRKFLEGDFDLHSGGVDHYFPHHENEVAQNIGATGNVGVNYWVHFGLLSINGEKMSKSKNNFVTAIDALKEFSPEALRMWIFSSHYKSGLDYSENKINDAQKRVDKINEFIQRMLEIRETGNQEGPQHTSEFIQKYHDKFEEAMDNDLQTPEALAVLFEMMTEANKMDLSAEDAGHVIAFLEKINSVFKFMDFEIRHFSIPQEIQKILAERDEARKNKNFEKADELRDKIQEKGFEVIDAPEGTKVKKYQ